MFGCKANTENDMRKTAKLFFKETINGKHGHYYSLDVDPYPVRLIMALQANSKLN